MRWALALAGLLSLQAGQFGAVDPSADVQPEPRHLLYERPIVLPAESSGGLACATLDAAALAHAASRSGDDLRIFAEPESLLQAEDRGAQRPDAVYVHIGASPREVAFILTESAAAPGDAEPATVQNPAVSHGDIVFDLSMPHRAYTTVDLRLAANDFVATAQVWGMQTPGGARTDLGRFVIFDLSKQHLPRSTSLPLQETQFPLLHIDLHQQSSGGQKPDRWPANVVQGADVPPSREAQTLYTPVASTGKIGQQGAWSSATLKVPAHVPIERVRFVLDPRFEHDFLRPVTITARPLSGAGAAGTETVQGEIWRVVRGSLWPGGPDIHQERLTVDAVLASNLRSPAKITVALNNGSAPALPIREIQLEMRQRQICFQAAAGVQYTLRYGDAMLPAPRYDFTGLASSGGLGGSVSSTGLIAAQLGPERVNSSYVARSDVRPYAQRHPELLWIVLLASTTLAGMWAAQSAKRKGNFPKG